MKLPEKLREWLPFALITGTIAAIGTLLTSIYKDAACPFLAHVLPAIKNQTLLLLCLLLFLACGLLAAWVCFLIFGEKPIMDKYVVMPDRAFAKHKKTGQIVCASCLVVGTISPLVKGHDLQQRKVWACMNKTCGTMYPRKLPQED